ncbi:hypothetical protein LCGC14_1102130, partial [marine sediment metagenome]
IASMLPKVATGTALKTMLQVKIGAIHKFKVVEWGISFDASAAAVPIQCELIETGTVFATVTAHVTTGIHRVGDPDENDPVGTQIIVGTAATGYTATAEGTVTATRLFDAQLVQPTGGYVKQWPLGREPVVNHDAALRIRVLAPVDVDCECYVEIEL